MDTISAKALHDVWATEIECLEILDLRSLDLFNSIRIPSSTWCSMKTILNKLKKYNPDKLMVLVTDQADSLKGLVGEHFVVLEGGVQAWCQRGYPTTGTEYCNERKDNE